MQASGYQEIPLPHETVEQGQLYRMQLMISLDTLILDIVVYHRQIAILTYGICIVSRCPEIASPQKSFYFRMVDTSRGDAFDFFDHI
ncbi:MAG: hypothetical protein G01um101466_504 [Parcubacteria group bacterium Gr01-1014_66]|nr:MAG: hypothetical protein G01um101466_504 [Parcubacteria group bacterium Gr01-1014_66]